MNQYKHLTLEERKSIERALTQGESFKFIARNTGYATRKTAGVPSAAAAPFASAFVPAM